MADEANEPVNAHEISEDDLRQVAGGSTPLNTPEIKPIENLPIEPAPTQSNPGKTNVGWDIAKNSSS
jgi:hypothetical protein